VFGIGAQEMVIIGLLLLIIFGPSKLPGMARDVGRFVNEARRSVEDFKENLASEVGDDQEPREDQDSLASGALEEDRHDEDATVARSTPPTE
jgi:Tat protein translocase TatB subunit